jgi:hypothetical protein
MIEIIGAIITILAALLPTLLAAYTAKQPARRNEEIDRAFASNDVYYRAVVIESLADRVQRHRAESLARQQHPDS